MNKVLSSILLPLALTAGLSGCFTLEHRVGTGASTGVEAEERQWYALFGLVPLNDVDSAAMATGATSYDVKSEATPIDFLLNLITGWVTIYSQTVTVTK